MAIIKKSMVIGGTTMGMGLTSLFGIQQASADTETTGHLDVSVDHSNLDEAVSHAQSAGIKVVRTETEVLTGDANKTAENIAKAKEYYKTQAEKIEAEAQKAQAGNAEAEQKAKQNKQDVENANGVMSALRSNLAVYGQTATATSKEYSKAEYDKSVSSIKASLETGRKYRSVKNEIADFNTHQNAYTSFQSQADAGNIKLQRETVRIANVGDTASYMEKIDKAYNDLQTYIRGLNSASGTIEESQKPTFTLYDIVVDDALVTEVGKPVEIPTWTPAPVEPVEKPTLEYKYFDIRSTPVSKNGVVNADTEVVTTKETKEDGTKVYQALKNQTVGVVGENEPLPDGRFDKIHNIITEFTLPEGVELDETLSKTTDEWKFSYDKERRVARYEATNRYLLQVNNKQNVRNGVISGTVAGEWHYTTPGIFLKATEDDKQYIVKSRTMINDEYATNAKDIVIQTNAATPEKHNKDTKGVVIDGKTVWFGTTNNYHISWDFDQYKGVNVDKKMQEKGLFIADYAPFDVLEMAGNPTIKHNGEVIATGEDDGSFVDATGKKIDGLTWAKVDSIEGIEEKGSAIKVGITGFDHPWYKEYVEKGVNLEVLLPMKAKVIDNTPEEQGGTYGGQEYKNVAYQSDFGNVYKTNEVVNRTPITDPRKDAVVAVSDLTSMDLKNNPTATIEKGTYFQYRAKSSVLDGKEIHDFTMDSYTVKDTFHEADQYDGVYYTETNLDIQFKEGSALYNRYKANKGIMPANSDITKFTTQKIARNVSVDENSAPGLVDAADTRVTKVELDFDADFLAQIDFTKTKFSVDTFFQVKRVKDVQGVTNIVEEVINGTSFGSNETKTNTGKTQLEKEVTKVEENVNNKNKEVLENLANVRKELEANRTSLADEVAKNSLSIKNLTTRVDKVEGVVEKHDQIVNLHSDALSVISKIQDTQEKRINEVAEKVKEELSTITIYVDEVVTDTLAFNYAVNHGVAPASIKSITLDDKGHFVVKYNANIKAVNGSKEATVNEENIEKIKKSQPERFSKYEFYTLKSESDVRKALADYGYAGERIKDIKAEGDKFTAIVDLGQAGETVVVPKAEVEPGKAGEQVDTPKPEVEPGKAGEHVDTPKTVVAEEPRAEFTPGKTGEKIELPGSETKGEEKVDGRKGSKLELPGAELRLAPSVADIIKSLL